MTDKKIKRFDMQAEVKDTGKAVLMRETFVKTLVDSMRDKGYVPVLDLDPYVVWDYKKETESFLVTTVVHGVFLGTKKAWLVEGLAGTREIPRTPPIK